MKSITYDQWLARFEITEPVDTDPTEHDDTDSLTFFDNGAVKENSTGDFIVKCDQVKDKP